jgi:hypothetical protein
MSCSQLCCFHLLWPRFAGLICLVLPLSVTGLFAGHFCLVLPLSDIFAWCCLCLSHPTCYVPSHVHVFCIVFDTDICLKVCVHVSNHSGWGFMHLVICWHMHWLCLFALQHGCLKLAMAAVTPLRAIVVL